VSNRHNSTYIMSHGVWFKFSSEDESSLIAFSGPSIKVVDLKREISTRRKLGSDENFELRVKDANGREYRDTDVVKKHTYVIVQRVTKSVGPYRRPKAAVQRQSVGGADAKEKFVFGEDVFEPKTKIETVDNLTEESKESEKSESALGGEPKEVEKDLPGSGVVESEKNNGRGTQIKSRSTGRPRGMPVIFTQPPVKKKAGGIPKCFLAAPAEKRAQALTDEAVRSKIKDSDIPDALKCQYTKELLTDAVMLPCCFQTCSYSAIQSALLAGNFVCPLCKAPNVGIDKLTPNRQLRDMVSNFIKSQRELMEAKVKSDQKDSSGKSDADKEPLENEGQETEKILDTNGNLKGKEEDPLNDKNNSEAHKIEAEEKGNQNAHMTNHAPSHTWNFGRPPMPRQWAPNYNPGFRGPPRGYWGRGPSMPPQWGPRGHPNFRGPPRGYWGPARGPGPGRGRPNWNQRGPGQFYDGPRHGMDQRRDPRWNTNEPPGNQSSNNNNQRERSNSRSSYDRVHKSEGDSRDGWKSRVRDPTDNREKSSSQDPTTRNPSRGRDASDGRERKREFENRGRYKDITERRDRDRRRGDTGRDRNRRREANGPRGRYRNRNYSDNRRNVGRERSPNRRALDRRDRGRDEAG